MSFNKSEILQGFRKSGSLASVIEFTDLVNTIQADSMEVLKRNKGGYFILLKSRKTGNEYQIGFGQSSLQPEAGVPTLNPSDNDDLRTIINESVIFAGNTDREGKIRAPWFSFGVPNQAEPVLTINVADLLAETAGSNLP